MKKIKIDGRSLRIIEGDASASIWCPMCDLSSKCDIFCAWFRIDNYYIDSNMKVAYCGDKLIGELEAAK